MNPHPDSMIVLAGIRHQELQAEAARMRLLREAQGNPLPLHAAVAITCRQLGAALGRVRQQLEIIGWALTVQRRGAFPR